MIRFAVLLVAVLVAGTVQAYVPMISNGDPPPFPERIELTAPGYKLVGGADLFVACADDGTLRLSAYASPRSDGSQGHTVFRVDVAQALLVELPEYRPGPVIRGSIFGGQPLSHCGPTDVLSVLISNPNAGRVFMQQGS